MEILQLVDQLEQTMNRGWRVPLSPSLIVNSEECLRLIDQMRISIPSAIKESERMITERDRIISDAQVRADQIIAHAEQQAIQIVSEDSITERAREEADRIIAHGHAEAIRLVDEAEVYALDVLYRLRDNLNNSLQQAENGIQAIEASQAPQEETGMEDSLEEFVPPPSLQSDEMNDESEDER
ncbi:MAG: hypothetical protein OXF55_12580 [Caldilineaceae bacterium]|nr:hypothetical protein [Caldilineaceae bacterium]